MINTQAEKAVVTDAQNDYCNPPAHAHRGLTTYNTMYYGYVHLYSKLCKSKLKMRIYMAKLAT